MNGKRVNEFRTCALLAGLLCLIACLLVLSPVRALAASATIFAEGVPGGVLVNTHEVNAKVVEIDHAKRTATLKDAEKGKTFTVKASPEAVNFDQVNVGDMVNFTLTEELVVYLDEEGASTSEVTSGVVATAPKGAQPGGFIAGTRQVTGTVTAIDLKKRSATLEFKDGRTETFQVRKDVDLTKRKVGDRVVFRLTEKIAISVEKP